MLDWLTKEEWCQGSHALTAYGESEDSDGNLINLNSAKAASWDLYGALRISYFDNDQFYAAIDEIKRVFKMLYKERWESLENTRYYKKDGKLEFLSPRLYEINDSLENFDELKRILFYCK